MARCIFCDEWAGPSSDRHEECALEFEQQMQQPGLVQRIFRRTLRATRSLFGVISSPEVRTR